MKTLAFLLAQAIACCLVLAAHAQVPPNLANVITGAPAANTPLSGSDLFPIVQNGILKNTPGTMTGSVTITGGTISNTTITGGSISNLTQLAALGSGSFIGSQNNPITFDGYQVLGQSSSLTAAQIVSESGGGGPYWDAVRGVVKVPALSTAQNTNAIGAYVENSQVSTPTSGGGVGLFSYGYSKATDAHTWGGNTLGVCKSGIIGCALYGWELDFVANNASDQVLGVILAGSSSTQPAVAIGAQLNDLSTQSPGTAKWTLGFSCADGVLNGFCLYAGAAASSGSNVASEPIGFGYRDSGGTYRTYTMNVDTNGDFFVIDSAAAGTHKFWFDLLNVTDVGTLTVGGFGATVGTGEVALKKVSASGVAPGAGWLKFEAVAGTMANTCKIIAYAGTSNTPVTVVDNVGGGC